LPAAQWHFEHLRTSLLLVMGVVSSADVAGIVVSVPISIAAVADTATAVCYFVARCRCRR
jgi:hypothetical protein